MVQHSTTVVVLASNGKVVSRHRYVESWQTVMSAVAGNWTTAVPSGGMVQLCRGKSVMADMAMKDGLIHGISWSGSVTKYVV